MEPYLDAPVRLPRNGHTSLVSAELSMAQRPTVTRPRRPPTSELVLNRLQPQGADLETPPETDRGVPVVAHFLLVNLRRPQQVALLVQRHVIGAPGAMAFSMKAATFVAISGLSIITPTSVLIPIDRGSRLKLPIQTD